MLAEIAIRQLGVIEDATLEVDPGLTVVTGETGAGKTMLVTALMLLQGGRADPGLVRHGAAQARVECRVSVARLPAVRVLVDEAGGEIEDEAVIVARTLGAAGRSRAHLGGASVPASTLSALGDQLVAVHGQADQLRLRQPSAQKAALDRFAGAAVADMLDRYRPAYRRLADIDRQLEALRLEAGERVRELDLVRLGLDDIAAVAPEVDEDDTLRLEEDKLAHAEALQRAANAARAALAGDDAQPAAPADVLGLLAAARAALDGVRDHDPAVAVLADATAAIGYTAADLAGELSGYAHDLDLDLDPLRLAAVQDRRAVLATLARRYGPTLVDVAVWQKQAEARLVELHNATESGTSLAAERKAVLSLLIDLAQHLSGARRQAGFKLAAAVTAELAELAMPHARLSVRVRSAGEGPVEQRLGPDGVDEVELLLAANSGASPRPLGRGASGGELSRVMLGLEVVLSATTRVPTYVFDEVDAGIGGKAAVEVGRRLARLAKHAQVLAVTHLPQVAAFADRHYLVDKSGGGTVTTSDVRALDEGARVRELSRMLAGLEGSATAEAHARELLDLASHER